LWVSCALNAWGVERVDIARITGRECIAPVAQVTNKPLHLVQILLPLYDPQGERFPRELYGRVKDELTEKFGGLTAYARAPAEGLWEAPHGGTQRDDIVVYEVMAEELDASWWEDYRRTLEERFRQRELVVRAHAISRL
jgi:hypothetical protein